MMTHTAQYALVLPVPVWGCTPDRNVFYSCCNVHQGLAIFIGLPGQFNFEEAMNPGNFRWPRRGDRLLRESKDWSKGVDFGGDKIARHVAMSEGYMLAGELLIDNCDYLQSDHKFLIYPILNCYRQGLELEMKWVIRQYRQYTDVSLDEEKLIITFGICGSCAERLSMRSLAKTLMMNQPALSNRSSRIFTTLIRMLKHFAIRQTSGG